MKAGYRKFYKYFSILVFMGCGYLMLNFWEEGKGQISSYNMQDKALMILWFMIYTFGTAAGIINTLTSIYIYEWGMQISFLKYKKKSNGKNFLLYEDIIIIFLQYVKQKMQVRIGQCFIPLPVL